MSICEKCGFEAKRIQVYKPSLEHEHVVKVCPNCFSEAISNAKTLRRLVGETALHLVGKGVDIDWMDANDLAKIIAENYK